MKRQALHHTKLDALMRLLKLPRWGAVGILESLWHLTAREAPLGDIGRLSDERIARGIDWRSHSPAQLISALVQAGWLDLDPEPGQHRLIVHGWSEHADDAVRKYVHRNHLTFACRDMSGHVETCPPRARALPVPEPVPEPEPENNNNNAQILPEESPVQHPEQNPKAEAKAKRNTEARMWFDTEFWPAWPLKKGKTEARKAALKINTPELRSAVMAGLRSQLPEIEQRIQEGRPVKWAQGWLNNKRWEDEPQLALVAGTGRPVDRHLAHEQRVSSKFDEFVADRIEHGR